MSTAKRRTTDKIKASLTAMLEKTPIEDITATALCEYAKINRATFYYHYDSVHDVFAEIERQTESEFAQWLSQSIFNSDGSPEKGFYVSFFEFISRNASVCRMLLGARRQSNFISRAVEAGREKVVSTMTKLFPDCQTSKIDYYYIFVSNGFLGLLEYWLNSGMRESTNEIAEIGENILRSGIEFLR
ncbi:MAG: TetR/AcrR family transcriptional regulator [Clostridiales bacterium]|nr:TetR/AcrR family transcriptional regulator [Clostridiales bacterium]